MPVVEDNKLETKNDALEKVDKVDPNANYIEAIKKLKENSVSKEDYDRLMEENKQLVETLMNGGSIEDKTEDKEVDLDELRDSLFNKENTNLSYIEKTLQLRDELLKRGEPDPFLPHGSQINATDYDIQTAEKVADALKDCVEYANGDSEIFTQELQRIMVDNGPRRR